MQALVIHRKNFVSILLILGFIIFVASAFPALATNFEIGTQFGISHFIVSDEYNDTTSITYTQTDIRLPFSLYTTWFPNKQFAIGPEFSFGRTSISTEYGEEKETDSITILHLGVRASYFLFSHAVSSPYVLGRVSQTFSGEGSFLSFLSDDNLTLTSFGGSVGYQWRVVPAFVLRVEGQYQRLLISDGDEGANEFSLNIEIGTRFGNNNNQQ